MSRFTLRRVAGAVVAVAPVMLALPARADVIVPDVSDAVAQISAGAGPIAQIGTAVLVITALMSLWRHLRGAARG